MSANGASLPPSPPPASISMARPRPGPAARWVTSPAFIRGVEPPSPKGRWRPGLLAGAPRGVSLGDRIVGLPPRASPLRAERAAPSGQFTALLLHERRMRETGSGRGYALAS